MTGNSIHEGRPRIFQMRQEPLQFREQKPSPESIESDKSKLSERIRRLVGINIGTLRVYRTRTEKHGTKQEAPQKQAPPQKSGGDKVGVSLERSIGTKGGYRSDIVLPETISEPLPLNFQKLEYYRNYKMDKDPDYAVRKEFPNLTDPDVHPDEAKLDLEKRASMAYLVQYGGIFADDPVKSDLIEKIIDRGSASAALRFLVYYTNTFDNDPRMNRYFEQYVDEKKESRGHMDQFDARTPHHYKSFKEFYHTGYDVFRRRN